MIEAMHHFKYCKFYERTRTGCVTVIRQHLFIKRLIVYGDVRRDKISGMVDLKEWAKHEFGDEAPGRRTLHKYTKYRMMVPPALKVGKKWMVDRNARYVDITSMPQLPGESSDKLRRILSDGCKTTFQ